MTFKTLALAAGLALSIAGKAQAGTFGTFFDSLFQKQNFVFLEEAAPIFFYDLGDIGANKTRGGFISPWYKFGFLSADAGFLTGTLDETPFTEGNPLLGGTVHIDTLVSMYFPAVTDFVYALTPDSSHALIKRVTIGFGFAHNFHEDKFVNGVYTGVTWKF